MINHWNYRVVEMNTKELRICEVFYRGDRIVDWGPDTPAPTGDTPDDLRFELTQMLDALGRPVLRESELPTLIEQPDNGD